MVAGRDTRLALAYLEMRHYRRSEVALLQAPMVLERFFIFPSTEDSEGGVCPLVSDENFTLVHSDTEPF